ncbi:MAG: DinB family protein [Acidimicrobiales bacterium]
MNPELQDYLRQIDAVTADARGLVASVADAEWRRRPAPDRWSIAENIEHLSVGMRRVMPAIDRAIEDARARGLTAPGPFRYGWVARMMVRSMEPPVKRRMKTSPIFMPGEPPARDAALAELSRTHAELAARVRRADGLDLKRAKVTSPVSRFIRVSLGAYVAFLLAHDRRHLWHVRQILAPGYIQGSSAVGP